MDRPGKKSDEEEKAKSGSSKESDSKTSGGTEASALPKKPFSETGAIPKKPFWETGAIPKKPSAYPVTSPKKPTGDPVTSPRKPSAHPVSSPKYPSAGPGSSPRNPFVDPGSSPKNPFVDPGSNPKNPSVDPGSSPKNPSVDPGSNPKNPSVDPGSNPKNPSVDPGRSLKKPSAETVKVSKEGKVKYNTFPRETARQFSRERSNIEDLTIPLDIHESKSAAISEVMKLNRDSMRKHLKKDLPPKSLPASSCPQSPDDDDDDSDSESFGSSDEEPQEGTDTDRGETYYDEEDTKELGDLKKEIQRNRTLLVEVQTALDVFRDIQHGGLEEVEKRAEDDLIYAARCLVLHVQDHVDCIRAHAERLSVEIEREVYLSKHPLPWFGIRTFGELISHLAARKGITVSPMEVKDTINIDLVLNKHKQLNAKTAVHDRRLSDIFNDIAKYNELAEKIWRIREMFTKTMRIGKLDAAKTLEQKQSLFAWLKEMALACDDHLTLSTFALLLVQDKVYELVTENALLMREYRYFLKRRHFLFKKIG